MSIYMNFKEHSNDPDNVPLIWNPHIRRVHKTNHKKKYVRPEDSLQVLNEVVIDDLFATGPPLDKRSPALIQG